MAWNQIELAFAEKRRELCLTGGEFSAHLAAHDRRLDALLFDVPTLNFLSIHGTCLERIPAAIAQLRNLQTLSLHSNRIDSVPECVAQLDKLKVLDLSHNCIASVDADLSALEQLATLNLAGNQLRHFPPLTKNAKLQVLDLSSNRLAEFPDICSVDLVSLSDVKLSNNAIESTPPEIYRLASLKLLDLGHNQMTAVPAEVTLCAKLKELTLNDNPIKDRRLLKLIAQCRTKQVLDYVKQHCKMSVTVTDAANAKPARKKTNSDGEDVELPVKHTLHVSYCNDATLRIIIEDDVKPVRPHIVCCLLHGVAFNAEILKKFLQLQTRLHDTLCEKRNAAAIATHDASKLVDCDVIYTAMKPSQLMIKPLNREKSCSGQELFQQLQAEAESLRKEKKRNAYTGIHKYLYLLEGKPLYACLQRRPADGVRQVISFPPITNGDETKMSIATTSLLLEVTGPANVPLLRKIMDTLILDAVLLFADSQLTVEQCKIVDSEGNIKLTYPSKVDLLFERHHAIAVRRD